MNILQTIARGFRSRHGLSGQSPLERVTAHCPGCCRDVTFLKPSSAARGQVTCSRCKRTFDWAPHRPEVAELPFRCSQTGEAFLIAFGRERAFESFTIRQIELGKHSLVGEGYKTMTDGALSMVPVAGVDSPARPPRYELGVPAQKSYALSEFALSDFECPACKFKPNDCGSAFFVCGRCGENVCGSRITTDARTGHSYARCHDACGCANELTETIDSIEGRGIQAISRLDPPSKAPAQSILRKPRPVISSILAVRPQQSGHPDSLQRKLRA
jgi:hypothetical protein